MKYFINVNFNTDELLQVKGNEIKVSIKSKPELGKANRELLKLLSNYFHVPSEKIKIIHEKNLEKK